MKFWRRSFARGLTVSRPTLDFNAASAIRWALKFSMIGFIHEEPKNDANFTFGWPYHPCPSGCRLRASSFLSPRDGAGAGRLISCGNSAPEGKGFVCLAG